MEWTLVGIIIGVVVYMISSWIERRRIHDEIKRQHPYWPDVKEQKKLAKKKKKRQTPNSYDPFQEPIVRYFEQHGLKVSSAWSAHDDKIGILVVFDDSVNKDDIIAFQNKHRQNKYFSSFISAGIFAKRLFIGPNVSEEHKDDIHADPVAYEEWIYIAPRAGTDEEDLMRWKEIYEMKYAKEVNKDE